MSPPTALDVRRIEAHLDTRWVAHPFEVVAVTASTNDAVLGRAQTGAAPGLALAAEAQSAGRGRFGRAFESSAMLGLWCSVLLRTPRDPANAARLSMLIAIGAARAIEQSTAHRPSLKWPNDVLLGGRKVAGILVEARTAGREMFVVAGIGINVHHRSADFSPEIREVAGSLESETGGVVDRDLLAVSLFREIESVMEAEDAGRFDLAREFEERDSLHGREVSVSAGGAGAIPVAGCALGVEQDGRLRLRLADGRLATFRAGEVTLRGM